VIIKRVVLVAMTVTILVLLFALATSAAEANVSLTMKDIFEQLLGWVVSIAVFFFLSLNALVIFFFKRMISNIDSELKANDARHASTYKDTETRAIRSWERIEKINKDTDAKIEAIKNLLNEADKGNIVFKVQVEGMLESLRENIKKLAGHEDNIAKALTRLAIIEAEVSRLGKVVVK
jgi:hypothetical protein